MDGNYNFHSCFSGCLCPHCEDELKNSHMRPTFCKPCELKAKNIKVCSVCQAEYSLEYEKCPACFVIDKERE
ncbi:MAG: hypothetical protein LBL02_02230 [Endomicrobium sp.]|jgi:hypothetical protein|nr:hypothetical protein [Endomicrobium sp.]